MDTTRQNVTLIALSGLVVALVTLLAYGWHKTTMSAPTLPCENDTIVNTLHIPSCGDYDLYTRVNGDAPDQTK